MSDDLINRSDAIDAIEITPFEDYGDYETAKAVIEQLPSASRPQGEWIFRREFVEDTPFTGYRCSNCNYWQGVGAWNFCPHCGCRMKGADDE